MNKKYCYLVIIEDYHGHDEIDESFNEDELEKAMNLFDAHKSAKEYYCRLERAEIVGTTEDGHILDNNETIDSYFPEDETK